MGTGGRGGSCLRLAYGIEKSRSNESHFVDLDIEVRDMPPICLQEIHTKEGPFVAMDWIGMLNIGVLVTRTEKRSRCGLTYARWLKDFSRQLPCLLLLDARRWCRVMP